MRVTFNSGTSSYMTNLNNLQEKLTTVQTKISTGDNILTLADDPKNLVASKQLTNLISRNKQYISNMSSALEEMQDSSDTMTAMTDKITQILNSVATASQTENASEMTTIAGTIEGYFEDLVNDANTSYNGTFIYAGTDTKTKPIELNKNDTSDSSNYSKLSINFNGNNNDRLINKDTSSTESINAKAENMFGQNNEMFSSIINIINTIKYNSSGKERGVGDSLTSDEISKLDSYQKTLQDYSDNISGESSRLGAKINRLTAISSQTTEENTKLSSALSTSKDADYAQTSLELAKTQTALSYSLKVGSSLLSQTLFDFLS
jgi:flagellar hook-associated protein 3 FlgL